MLRILSHPDCAGHVTPNEHPESPARLAAAMRGLERMSNVHFRQATPVDEAILKLAHTPHHLHYIEELYAEGKAQAIDPDTWFGPGTLQASRLAAGAACDAVDQVMENRCQRAFAVVRPPGHHAESYRAMGFCIYNNIALAAARALSRHGLERVAICDFDVHHGNGTEEIVSGNEEILFASSHQSPLFPDTGDPETTLGGNIHNATLSPGSTSDAFRDVWLSKLLPRIEAFRPQLVLSPPASMATLPIRWRSSDSKTMTTSGSARSCAASPIGTPAVDSSPRWKAATISTRWNARSRPSPTPWSEGRIHSAGATSQVGRGYIPDGRNEDVVTCPSGITDRSAGLDKSTAVSPGASRSCGE